MSEAKSDDTNGNNLSTKGECQTHTVTGPCWSREFRARCHRTSWWVGPTFPSRQFAGGAWEWSCAVDTANSRLAPWRSNCQKRWKKEPNYHSFRRISPEWTVETTTASKSKFLRIISALRKTLRVSYKSVCTNTPQKETEHSQNTQHHRLEQQVKARHPLEPGLLLQSLHHEWHQCCSEE